jgi:polar amino acid transport system permease protein
MSASQFIEHARDFLPILLQGAVVTVEVTLLSFLSAACSAWCWR